MKYYKWALLVSVVLFWAIMTFSMFSYYPRSAFQVVSYAAWRNTILALAISCLIGAFTLILSSFEKERGLIWKLLALPNMVAVQFMIFVAFVYFSPTEIVFFSAINEIYANCNSDLTKDSCRSSVKAMQTEIRSLEGRRVIASKIPHPSHEQLKKLLIGEF